ncbi:MAG: orotate phosphoribosyltransferase [Paludibacteraceae bacterium]|nr:orotate phosphoribosyltransferase [Paludibacteraceae bacterium]
MSILQNMTALKLLQLKAFKFQLNNPFKWANGWLAPLYCDDRKVLSYPKMRDFIRLELARTIAELYPDADVIAGVAMNAIAHGVLVAEQLSLPFVYVHPTPKDHGLENQIEGDLRPRQSVVIVENQVNAGNNCVKIVEALRNNGCKILGIVTIFDFEFPSTQRKLNKLGVDLTALTNLDTILHHAVIMGMINKEEEKAIKEWQNKPSKWNK